MTAPQQPGYDWSAFYPPPPRLAEVNGMSLPEALVWYARNWYNVHPGVIEDGQRKLARPPGYSYDTLPPLTVDEAARMAANWQPEWRFLAMVLGKGSGWAIDVDDMAQWEAFKAEMGDALTQTATEQTGSGKLHLLYTRPDEDELPPQALRRGAWSDQFPRIEVLSKNIMVVAPSPHHVSGQPNQWLEVCPQQPREPAGALLERRARTRLDEMITERQFALHIDREARRREDAAGWQQPDRTVPLTDELALARTMYAYRIDSLAGWNHNVLVAGERKLGKTTLMINLTAALSVAAFAVSGNGGWTWTPGQFLGPWTRCWAAGNVAYWNAEMDADDFRDEFRRLPAQAFDPARIFPLHFRGVAMPVITNPAARAWFTRWLKEHQIETLIIDTWGQFCAQNGVRKPSDDGEVRPLLDGLDAIKREAGVASLFILIHMPHQTGEKHLERFKGAGAVGDWADTLWTYVKDAEGVRYLWAEGRARIAWEETSLSWIADTGQLAWSYQGNRMQTARERQRSRAVKALEAAGEKGLGAEDLKDAAGGNRAAAGEVIGKIVGDGLADMERNGRAKIYRLKDYRKDQPDQGK